MARAPKGPKQVTTLNHEADARRNIPTAEMADLAAMQEERDPLQPVAYPRARPLADGEVRQRDEDLDPQIVWNGVRITLTKGQVAQLAETGTIEVGNAQLVWRGKDRQDWSDLIVTAPPLYIQEKVHPKAIIDDLVRQSKLAREDASRDSGDWAPDLFADFNGLADPMARTEFYQHDQHWSNRMILGDSLQVMASLAEREAMKGKMQAIYFDPPYGIKFNSNWQVSTQSKDVKDGRQTDISREPEQVKAFRDTWKDGIHSYLTYLRDRFTAMRELLSDSGSIFVQIGDENLHRVRAVLDEVFSANNFVAQIQLKKSGGATSQYLPGITDFVCWFCKSRDRVKFRKIYQSDGSRRNEDYGLIETGIDQWMTAAKAEDEGLTGRPLQLITLTSQRQGRDTSETSAMGYPFGFRGRDYRPSEGRGWTTTERGMRRLASAGRIGIQVLPFALRNTSTMHPARPLRTFGMTSSRVQAVTKSMWFRPALK